MEVCSESKSDFKLHVKVWNYFSSNLTTEDKRSPYYLRMHFISFDYLSIFSMEFSDYSETHFLCIVLIIWKEFDGAHPEKQKFTVLGNLSKWVANLTYTQKKWTSYLAGRLFRNNIFINISFNNWIHHSFNLWFHVI